jgi:integrase
LPIKRDRASGRFSGGAFGHEGLAKRHKCVYDWLKNKPFGTQQQYGLRLKAFCEAMDVTPEQFQDLDPKGAHDLAWEYVSSLIRESPSTAKNTLAALKSFYRNKDGVKLSFDSQRGGKHYFNSKRRKKAAFEHVPTKVEMYRIVDMATSMRDKTILLVLFQSGIRENALCSLRYGHVKRQLENGKFPLRLRITPEIDSKLAGYGLDYYDTFLQYEAIEALKQYYEEFHRKGDPDEWLFYSKQGTPMSRQNVWAMVKRAVKRAGFDPKTMWVHTIRRAFKKQVRKAPIDDDFKEAIMGHVLPGSRENYFSRNDVKDLENAYMQIDFSREIPTSETQRLKEQLEKERIERTNLETLVIAMRREMEELKESLKGLKASS